MIKWIWRWTWHLLFGEKVKYQHISKFHNNLNHCNAAGCDGVQCGPEHTKGDF
jgi:hypothetical protein